MLLSLLDVNTKPLTIDTLDSVPGVTDYLLEGDGLDHLHEAEDDEKFKSLVLAAAQAQENGLIHPFDVLLDNQSELHLIGNSRLVKNIRSTKNKVNASGIGTLRLSKIADFPGLSEPVYYHAQSPVNVLSFSKLRNCCTIESCIGYDFHQNSFWANIGGVKREFRRVVLPGFERDFYACRFPETGSQCNVPHQQGLDDLLFRPQFLKEGEPDLTAIETVKERKAQFSKPELKQAMEARVLAYRMVNPAVRTLVDLVKKAGLLNSDVTPDDIRRYAFIHGPETAYVMGTAKNQSATPDIRPLESLEPVDLAQRKQRLSLDLFIIEKMLFLISKSSPCDFTMTSYIPSRSVESIWHAMQLHLAEYKKRGFEVVEIASDGEGAVRALLKELAVNGITLDRKGTGQHVGVAERTIQSLKNKVRIIKYSLPYRMPRILLAYAVLHACNSLNYYFRAGYTDNITRWQSFHGRKLDAKRDLRFIFGEYALAIEPNTDASMHPRATGVLLLLSSGNRAGSVYCLNLATWRVTLRDTFVPKPISSEVIKYINTVADAERVAMKLPLNSDPEFYYNGKILSYAEADEDDPVFTIQDVIGETVPSSVRDIDDGAVLIPPNTEGAATSFNSQSVTNRGIDVNVHELDQLVDDYLPDPASFGLTFQHSNQIAEVNLANTSSASLDDDGDYVSRAVVDFVTPTVTSGRPVQKTTAHKYDRLGKRDKVIAQLLQTQLSSKFAMDKLLMQLSSKNAIAQMPDPAIEALVKEMFQLDQRGIFEPTSEPWDITSSGFVKNQFYPSGLFKKCKGRFVAGGHMQDRSNILPEDYSAPTVKTQSVFMCSAINATENRYVATLDVPGAFLNADANPNNPVNMKIDALHASILCAINPEKYKPFLRKDGSLVVRIIKALYGLIESAKAWYILIKSFLMTEGFEANPLDECVFNKVVDGQQVTILLHVDDLKLSSTNKSALESILKAISDRFTGCEVHWDRMVEYLGMTFDYDKRPGSVFVTQRKLVEEILKNSGIEGTASTPALDSLFHVREDADLLPTDDKEEFHSLVAMLLYLCLRSRPDMLCAVSFLTTRVLAPDTDDALKLDRVIKYLNGTKDLGIFLNASKMRLIAYVDAAHGVHTDGKGRTGSFITLGCGPSYARSSKQKTVSISSMESEVNGVSTELSEVLFDNDFLKFQGYNLGPALVAQDNQSGITVMTTGQSKSGRSKHITLRYLFIKDRIENGEIELIYTPTDEMVADILTKPLQGSLFYKLRDWLMGVVELPL
jgi:hypothetical protein